MVRFVRHAASLSRVLAMAFGCAGGGGCSDAAPPGRDVSLTGGEGSLDDLVARSHEGRRDPERVAIAVEGASSAPSVIRLVVGGDVLPHRPALNDEAQIGAALKPLAGLFGSLDGAVVNYETATGDPLLVGDRKLQYVARPGWMAAIAGVHVTGATLANNHACDLGSAGLSGSIAAARAANVGAIGASDGDPWAPVVVAEKNGKTICAVAWTTFVNPDRSACARDPRLAILPEGQAGRTKIVSAVAGARASCDGVVAIVHGGNEYEAQTARMLAMAKLAAEAGADAVVLHHPHVPSEVRVATLGSRIVPVFASVGNLVSNQGGSWRPGNAAVAENRKIVHRNAWTRVGVLADLEWRWTASGPANVTWAYHLVWTENDHPSAKSAEDVPTIRARLLDPLADSAVVQALRHDVGGPARLLDSPCWIEGALGLGGEQTGAGPRCATRQGDPSPSAAGGGLRAASSWGSPGGAPALRHTARTARR